MRITEDDQNVSNSSTSEKNANSPASSRRHGRLHHQQQEHQHLAAVAAEVAARLQEEKSGLQDQVAKQETDLNRLRAQFGSQCLESDQLKRKVTNCMFHSPAEWCIIKDGVCILSYKHEIFHKGAFGCALSYWSKRQTFFSQYGHQIQDGRHRPF